METERRDESAETLKHGFFRHSEGHCRRIAAKSSPPVDSTRLKGLGPTPHLTLLPQPKMLEQAMQGCWMQLCIAVYTLYPHLQSSLKGVVRNICYATHCSHLSLRLSVMSMLSLLLPGSKHSQCGLICGTALPTGAHKSSLSSGGMFLSHNITPCRRCSLAMQPKPRHLPASRMLPL